MQQPVLNLAQVHPTDAAHHTFARVITKDEFAGLQGVPFRLMTADLVNVLVLDLPDGIIPLQSSSVERFGGWDHLYAVGVDNLAHLDLFDAEHHGDENCAFTAVSGPTKLTASLMLTGADRIAAISGAAPGEDGYLFVVPHPGLFAFSVIRDRSAIPAMKALLRFAAHEFSQAEEKLSPHLFWQRGERIEQLSLLEGGGALSIAFSEDYRAVLDRVAAQKPRA